ncbi:MAG: T9SS type A sorting domain-containing protein [Bacteroidota bacterium]
MKKIYILICILLMGGGYLWAQSPIVAAEYFFDVDPGTGNGASLTIPNPADSINTQVLVSTVGIVPGVHNLFIRTQNQDGAWSLSESRMVIISPSSPQFIVETEYYFDQDPGPGNGTPVVPNTPGDSINVSLAVGTSGLTPGVHALFIRSKNSTGSWSLSSSQMVIITPALPLPYVAAEYFWDQDPGVGNGLPLSVATNGDTGRIHEIIPVPSNLSLGLHSLHIRVQSSNGAWSLFETREVEICTQYGPIASFDLLRYGNFLDLTNTSQFAEDVFWIWGDGQTDTARNPSHFYKNQGIYQGQLLALNICGTDTLDFQVTVGGIEGATPDKGGRNGLISGRISGFGFEEDSVRIAFVKSHDPQEILLPDTAIWINAQNIYFNLNLVGADTGFYDIVYLLDGQVAYTLEKGFFVEPLIQPEMGVEILGPSFLRSSRFGKYEVIIENKGNVDALFVPVVVQGMQTGEGNIFPEFTVMTSDNFPLFAAAKDPFVQVGGDTTDLNSVVLSVEIDSVESVQGMSFILSNVPPGKHKLSFSANSTVELKRASITVHVLNPWVVYTNTRRADSAFALADCFRAVVETIGDIAVLADIAPCAIAILSTLDALTAVGSAAHGIASGSGNTELIGIKDRLSKILGGQGNQRSPEPLSATIGIGGTTGAMLSVAFRCTPAILEFAFPAAKLTRKVVQFTKEAAGAVGNTSKGLRVASLFKSVYQSYERCFGKNGAITQAVKQFFSIQSADPNAKYGPGLPGDNFVTQGQRMNYIITFENVDSATAAAQIVTIHDTLDKEVFDLSTFEFMTYGFDSIDVALLTSEQKFTDIYDLRPGQPNLLRLEGSIDTAVGVVTWIFTTLDTTTLQLTEDVFEGFLPPNINGSEGQGFVSYSLHLKTDLGQGAFIRNDAEIIFDDNDPIVTNTWENIYDIVAPMSHILPLSSPPQDTTFQIEWEGRDDLSGIRSYIIYASTDNGPYERIFGATGDTTVLIEGEAGKLYTFISIATDRAGNIETFPTDPDLVVDLTTANDPRFTDAFRFYKIFPQPAREQLYVEFELPTQTLVTLSVVDMLGRPVKTEFVDRVYPVGRHQVQIDLQGLAAGMYNLQIRTPQGALGKVLAVE